MKRIVVLGAGESGVGSAILAQKQGFDVFVSDMSPIKEKYVAELNQYNIAWEQGQHTEELILNADEVIKSPGIPEKAPIIKKLREKGINIISEIEFAGRYSKSKMICITGSNGKTTTTTLVHYIFKEAGLDASLAGNIGFSLARQVAIDPHDYYIIELSSFQLDGMYDFKADIAILLNITPDHLDRYDYKFQNYVDSKMRIIQNMTENDTFIYWNEDPVVTKELPKYDIKAKMMPFSIQTIENMAAYLENEKLVINLKNNYIDMDINKLALKGQHNIYNSMAAGIAAGVEGIKKDTIRKAFSDFSGVEHRLEPVAKVRSVLFINDSKATNVNSCWYALQCMQTPVVLILGGKDKGNDYTEIEDLVKEKVKAIVCLGVDNTKLHQFFDGKVENIADASSMEEAVNKCFAFADKGDTVLLSPCCASFDLFKSYEDRGQQFKECVKRL
ncbi:MAG: UDP-N-acetylmuramoyl-L-alanine--D-glutamate ligase [Paludibacteraceae bacterium]|jgi:UDP-N-acetylmuramoylalanine--D-glutamate ligase|nr:UDP-N-acetylmuramoyl-L-alanine--D-glutamate ligase [Paludibacteraceae bacterium]MDD5996312.1 UDP-N-acetylmuramoyl-L-alanine--D-glutamate ligase [Bacteroidales bacterium]MBQ6561712.1 UDP-N-acetylmuramoyl-L-alanine--D-glutamate ligase [Paludibacteraceae bacterium]MBR6112665.1 UDP-N-acetylmuramoyl-L-alanine--D-glutamate ligase [Paludibacteraceae bacterium]MBS7363796.1 UDP-N-acetylmuramoyl-L-alanine--D-glutamate ligase [Paludibacteraceae bacterium]